MGEGEHASSQAEATAAEGEALELEELVSGWNALELPEAGGTVSRCRPSERSAIRNRLRDVGRAVVALAIAGAGASPWLRAGRARSAIAIVFADVESVRRFAEDGAELAKAAALERERRAREAADAARAWRELEAAATSPEAREAAERARLELARMLRGGA